VELVVRELELELLVVELVKVLAVRAAKPSDKRSVDTYEGVAVGEVVEPNLNEEGF